MKGMKLGIPLVIFFVIYIIIDILLAIMSFQTICAGYNCYVTIQWSSLVFLMVFAAIAPITFFYIHNKFDGFQRKLYEVMMIFTVVIFFVAYIVLFSFYGENLLVLLIFLILIFLEICVVISYKKIKDK